MKLVALLGAGALAIGTLVGTVAPAEAQRYGYDGGYRHHHGYYRGGYGRHDGYYRGGGYGRHYGYGYGRGRVVCRIHHGRYHPVRRCFRVYR
jgi:hypothetical protein